MSAVDVVIFNSEPWMAQAVCASADPEEWFPEKGSSSQTAKKICSGCPVVKECLQFALDHNEYGIWGGTSRRERIPMMRKAS